MPGIDKTLFPNLTRRERRQRFRGLILIVVFSLAAAGIVAAVVLWANSSDRFLR